MNGLRLLTPATSAGPVSQLFNCTHADCGMTFTRKWKLQEHEAMHAGLRPCKCDVAGCARTFTRRSHLIRHLLQHEDLKMYICKVVDCNKCFMDRGKLKRHVRYSHENKAKYFKCLLCSATFKKRRQFKLHLQEHKLPVSFKCTKRGCGATFDSHIARKAHEKKHAGYRCLRADCKVVMHTWGKLQKHMATHPATFTCKVCQRVFKKAEALRRHKRAHAFHKPVLVCPMKECDAYFSSTFNLQSHIRKGHLKALNYKCSFPDCTRQFAMRESLTRHLIRHDSSSARQRKRSRSKRSWQKRLEQNQPLVEEDLSRLFELRMRMPRRVKVEANLTGLFNDRKSPHYTDPEVNLRSLFRVKRQPMVQVPQVAPLKG